MIGGEGYIGNEGKLPVQLRYYEVLSYYEESALRFNNVYSDATATERRNLRYSVKTISNARICVHSQQMHTISFCVSAQL